MSGDNYPAGAKERSDAPFNKKDELKDLCSSCNKEEIEAMVPPDLEKGTPNYDTYLDNLLEKAGLCKACRLEEQSDNDNEDW